MAKRLNKKLVAMLTAIACLAAMAAGTAWVMRLRPRDARPFVELAEQAAKRGDRRRAIGLYGRAAALSRNAEFLAEAGGLWLEEGNVAMARATWEAGKTLDPSARAPRERLIRFLLDVAELAASPNAWQAVLQESRGLRSIQADSALGSYAQGRALLADASPSTPQWEEALASLRAAVESDPLDVEYTSALALALENQGSVAEAEAVLRALTGRRAQPSAGAAQARCALGAFLGRQRRLDDAKVAFDEALAMSSGDAQARSSALVHEARYHMARADAAGGVDASSELDQAAALLEEAVRLNPVEHEATLDLVRLDLRRERFEEALSRSAQRLGSMAPGVGLAEIKVKAQIYELTLLCADAASALARRPDLPSAVRDQHLGEALEWVHKAEALWAEGPRGLALEGEILLLQGKERNALERLALADREFTERNRVDWRVKTLLARLHLGFNESGAALELLERVKEQAERQRADDAAFWSTYADALIRNDRASEALSAAERALRAKADDYVARRVKVEALTRLGRVDEVGAVVESMDTSGSASVLLNARILASQDDLLGAFTVLAEALAENPLQPTLLREAVILAPRLGRDAEVRALVQSAAAKDPANVEVRRLQIASDPDLSREGRRDAILALIDADPDPLSRALRRIGVFAAFPDHAEVLETAAEAESALKAAAGLSDAQRLATMRFLVRHQLFSASALKDWTRAEAAVRSAEQSDLDGAGGALFKGELELRRGNAEQAFAALQSVAAAQPTNVFALSLLGECCEELSRLTDARAYFLRAVEANPNYGAAQRGLAGAAYRLGDEETYNRALTQCERLIPGDEWVAQHLLMRADERNPEEALQRRRELLAAHGDDVANLMQAARLCQRLRRIDEADGLFARALAVAPDDQSVVFKAADHYRGTQRFAEGERLIRAFIDRQKDETARARAMLTLAAFQLRSGRVSDEERTLLEAAALRETFETCLSLGDFYLLQQGRPVDAAPWYDKAMSLAAVEKNPRRPEAVIRRIMCAIHPKVGDAQTAGAILETAQRESPTLPEWRYWSAEVAVLQGRSQEAIRCLDEYLQARPDDPAGLYARAQQHIALGTWAAGIADLERIKASSPGALDLRPRMLLAFAYASTQKQDAAIRELESLVAEFPQSAAAAQELLAAYVRAGRSRDAERLLTAQVNRSADAGAAPWLRLRADLGRRAGQHAAALADDMRAAELLGYPADDVSRVLADHVRLSKFPEGAAYYESYMDVAKAPAVVRAQYAQLLQRGGRADRAAAEFAAAMQKALTEGYGPVLRVGRSAAQLQVSAEAREAFPAAIRAASPDVRVAALFECALDESTGNWLGASERMNQLIQRETDAATRLTLLRARAMLCHTNGGSADAIACYKAVVREDARDVVSLNNLANLLLSEGGDVAEAESYARKAVEAAEGDAMRAEVLDSLGWIHVREGRLPQAVAEITSAIRLVPDKAVFHYHLAESHRQAARFDLAAHALTAGLSLAARDGDAALADRIRAAQERVDKRDAAP